LEKKKTQRGERMVMVVVSPMIVVGREMEQHTNVISIRLIQTLD
jgi:hypothetical protein